MDQLPLTHGFCYCGCGQKTRIAKQTTKWGKVGEPYRFIHGHARRKEGRETPPGTKFCTWCHRLLKFEQFSPSARGRYGYHSVCKRCAATQKSKYKKSKQNIKNQMLQRVYGIDYETYHKMLAQQGGLCAICKGSAGNRMLAVDHNHKTKEIRKLLCHKCNTALGNFRERIDLLRAAIAYLESYEPPANDWVFPI